MKNPGKSAGTSAPEKTVGHSLGGLFKHSTIYSAAPVLRQFIAIGMTRFYTSEKWLNQAGYGVKEIVDLWMIGLQQLLGQNALGAMVRFYYEYKDEEDRKRVITTTTLVVTLLAWAVCGTAIAFSDSLRPILLGPGGEVSGSELTRILTLTLILIPFQLSSLSAFYYLQILKRSELYTGWQTLKLLFEVALNFYFIGHLGWGVRGFLVSMLAGEIVTSLTLTSWMLITLRPRIDLKVFRPLALYALPLIPVGICQFGLHQIDRRLLLHFLDADQAQAQTGIYGLGYKIGYLVTAMMLGPFLQIWQPWIFGVEDEEERAGLVARVSTYAVLVLSAASLGVILIGKQTTQLLSGQEAFEAAYRIVPLVATGYVFWALYQVSQFPLFIAKRTGRLFLINAIALLVNVGLNWVLIERMGVMGAAVATLTTFVVLAALGMIASRSEAHVPFELGRIARTIGVVILGAGLATWIDVLQEDGAIGLALALGAKALVGVVALAALYTLVLTGSERGQLLTFIRTRGRPALARPEPPNGPPTGP